jgi:hypothetical protein
VLTDKKISDTICHRVLELYNQYRDTPELIEKERNIKLVEPLGPMVNTEGQSDSLRLMLSIANVIVAENEAKYKVLVNWHVGVSGVDNNKQIIFNLTEIVGNKWTS